jgi:8-oxo-dGTP pyrophosphatase MutT (NUDIX family)
MRFERHEKVSQPSRLPKARQQVAAVCYRMRKRGVQFLLVQTRGGRWIFPKGGVEPGMTHAQSAALEAFEEGGVHGRIEEISFARYFRPKSDNAAGSSDAGPAITAYLCEVSQLELPQERERKPTWFSAEEAKSRLGEHRTREYGAELALVVDRALVRIHRLRKVAAHNTSSLVHKDGLQEVRFEAGESQLDHPRQAVLPRYFRRVFQIGASAEIRRPDLRLGTGFSADVSGNITAIDSGHKANQSKPGQGKVH